MPPTSWSMKEYQRRDLGRGPECIRNPVPKLQPGLVLVPGDYNAPAICCMQAPCVEPRRRQHGPAHRRLAVARQLFLLLELFPENVPGPDFCCVLRRPPAEEAAGRIWLHSLIDSSGSSLVPGTPGRRHRSCKLRTARRWTGCRTCGGPGQDPRTPGRRHRSCSGALPNCLAGVACSARRDDHCAACGSGLGVGLAFGLRFRLPAHCCCQRLSSVTVLLMVLSGVELPTNKIQSHKLDTELDDAAPQPAVHRKL